jgi:hypothetical protein
MRPAVAADLVPAASLLHCKKEAPQEQYQGGDIACGAAGNKGMRTIGLTPKSSPIIIADSFAMLDAIRRASSSVSVVPSDTSVG